MWEKIKIMSSNVWSFVLPFVRQMLKDSGPILMDIAMAAVLQVASGTSNLEKRQKAFEIIKTELMKKGIVFGESMINAAIEIAVVKSKEK